MRRFSSFILMLLIPFVIHSAVIYSDSVNPDMELEAMISTITEGRKDASVEVTSYEKKEDMTRLSLVLGGEEMSFVARDGRMLQNMLEDAFYQNPAFLEDGLSVDSIYGNLVSADGVLRKGGLWYACDADGERRALLRAVEELPEEKTLLSPMMRRDLYPGYTLEKGPVVALEFTFASPMTKLIFDTSVSARMVSLCSFLDPKVSINYIYSEGVHIAQVGLGIETHATLSKMFSSSFTLLEDGEIFASAEVLLGYGNGGFLPSVTYTVGYGHYAMPDFYWRVGYSGNTETGPEFRLGGGVLL